MKRITLAVILVAAACAATAFGASSTYPLAGNKSFTYWVVLPANVTTYAKDLNEIEFYKSLEKATGVRIEFQHPASGTSANMATGKVPCSAKGGGSSGSSGSTRRAPRAGPGWP